MMKKYRTTFLKFGLILIGIVVLALCIFWLPLIAEFFASNAPEFAYLQYPVLIGIYLTTLPFYFSLYQAYKLLKYIDQEHPFSRLSVTALKYIKISAIIIGILYVVGLFFLDFQGAGQPGISLLGLVIAFASAVISVFAAVLQELLEKAIELKEENQLTI
jgi:hypothetical protein